MKTYWVSWEMWAQIYEHLGEPACGLTDDFILSEYGLKADENADHSDAGWEYEVVDERLFALFLLRWS